MKKLKWQTTVTNQDFFEQADSVFICTDYSDFKIVSLSDRVGVHLNEIPLLARRTILCGESCGAWLKIAEEDWEDPDLEKALMTTTDENDYSYLPPLPVLVKRKKCKGIAGLSRGQWLLLLEGYEEQVTHEDCECYSNLLKDCGDFYQLEDNGEEVVYPLEIRIYQRSIVLAPKYPKQEDDFSYVKISDDLLAAIHERKKEMKEGK